MSTPDATSTMAPDDTSTPPSTDPSVSISSSRILREPEIEGINTNENDHFPFLFVAIGVGIVLLVVLSLIISVIVGFVLKRRSKRRTRTVWHTESGTNTYAAIPTQDSSSGTSSLSNDHSDSANSRLPADGEESGHSQITASATATVTSSADSGNEVTLVVESGHSQITASATATVTSSADSGNEATLVVESGHSQITASSTATVTSLADSGNEASLMVAVSEPCKKTDMQLEDMEAAVLEMSINETESLTAAAPPAYSTLEEVEHTLSATSDVYLDSCISTQDREDEVSEVDISEAEHIYSDVQRAGAPVVPPKSSDLKQYLATCSGFNEGIYSEDIDRSDFTHSDLADDDEVAAEAYAPLYPSPDTAPEDHPSPTEISIANITEIEKIGTGQFGETVSANATGLHLSSTDDESTIELVAVKKLSPNPSQTKQEVFTMEIKFMSQIRHPNVACLLGVCHGEQGFMVMEYPKKGDLNQFLKRYSEIVPSTPCSDTQITKSTLVHAASQIASAMQYLAERQFVHRDIATRNCLVGNDFTVKVADLGMNERLYKSHYYRIRGNKLMPIRWMATECFDGKFSEKSDVFAFGVTVWELFTLARDVPYPHLSDQEVVHNSFKREHRQFPTQPSASCPQEVYDVMEQCWLVDLQERVSFSEINILLQTCS